MSQTILTAVLILLFIIVITATLPLTVEYHHLPLWLEDSILLFAFRIPNPVTAIPTLRSGLQRRVITELHNDTLHPLLKLLMKSMSFGPSVGK